METRQKRSWIGIIPDGEELPIAALLDTDQVRTLLQRYAGEYDKKIISCRIAHIRYRPRKRCTISYEVKFADSVGTIDMTTVYLLCLTGKGFSRARDKLINTRPIAGKIGFGRATIPDKQAIVNEFPNDMAITELPLVIRSSELINLISHKLSEQFPENWENITQDLHQQTLRYKPESRFVSRCTITWSDGANGRRIEYPVILRFERAPLANHFTALQRRLHTVFASEKSIAVPKLLFTSAEFGFTALEAVAGEKLSDLLKTEKGERAILQTAGGLALLHTYKDSRISARTVDYYLERAGRTVDLLSYGGEEISSTAKNIFRQLLDCNARTKSDPTGFVHGDFHQGQVIMSKDKTTLLDFDRAHFGEVSIDLGSFLAQLHLLKLRGRLAEGNIFEQIFLQAYRPVLKKSVGGKRIIFWTAIALLELAGKEFRRLKFDWRGRIEQILGRCQEVLKE